MSTDFDFVSFVHPKGGTSCIDTMVVAPGLCDLVSAEVGVIPVLQNGHGVVCTILKNSESA